MIYMVFMWFTTPVWFAQESCHRVCKGPRPTPEAQLGKEQPLQQASTYG